MSVSPMPNKLVIRNIGLMLTGKIESPIAEGDCVEAVGGKIAAYGRERDLDTDGAATVVDAKGATCRVSA